MMVHLSVTVIRILRLRSASEISMIAGLVGFRFLLDSGLHVAGAVSTEAPLVAARDVPVDDAAPLVTAEGRWAATWAENPDAARACAPASAAD